MQKFTVDGTSNYNFVVDMIKKSITAQKIENTSNYTLQLGELVLQFGYFSYGVDFPIKYKQLLGLATSCYGHFNWGNHVPTSWLEWANGTGFRMLQACGDDDGAHITAGSRWGAHGYYIAIGIPEQPESSSDNEE